MARSTSAITAYSRTGILSTATGAGLEDLEVREGLELLVARIDLRPRQSAEALHAKLLAAEAAQDGTVDNGASQLFPVDLRIFQIEPAGCKRANEPAGEAVARARRIKYLVEKIARDN